MYVTSKDQMVGAWKKYRAMTSQATTTTRGTLSHAIHTPVRSVNLSMRLTMLIRPTDGSAMRYPLNEPGTDVRPRLALLRYFFFASAFAAAGLPPPSGQ